MGDDYTVVPVPGLPWLTEVRLYDETLEHIAAAHSEFRLQMPSQRTALEDAVANPNLIHISTTDPQNSVVFVSESFTYLGDPVVMPIKHVEGTTSGRIATAYFSGDAYRGRILWSAGNE